MAASGGEPEILVAAGSLGDEMFYYEWPPLLPGGKAVLFSAVSETRDRGTRTTEVLSLETRERKSLVPGAQNARYVPSGHILYGQTGAVRAIRFDLDSLAVVGSSFPVVERVRTKWTGATDFDVSTNGTLVYIEDSTDVTARSLVWVERDGTEEAVPVAPAEYDWPRLSPDSSRLTLTIAGDANRDVWTYDLVRGTLSRVTTDLGSNHTPIWTRDGENVVFGSMRDGRTFNLFTRAADGTGHAEKLVTNNRTGGFRPFDWSPDGNQLLFDYGGELGIGIIEMQGGEAPVVRPLIDAGAGEESPTLSPDGAWIAYASDQSGAHEIYVERFPELGDRQQISLDGGSEPLWSPKGDELFYRRGDALMAVPVTPGPQLRLGAPDIVFEGWSYRNDFRQRAYDVTPDGTRFIIIKEDAVGGDVEPVEIRVVQNWHEELKRLVPTEN